MFQVVLHLVLLLQPNGFNLEINNTNPNHVMVGVRVLTGSQTTEKAPAYLEIFGRTVNLGATRARWYDLPFTREESLTADKKFTMFGKYKYKVV